MKNVFIKDVKACRVYCSKCGKMVLQDTYNYRKHAEECDCISNFVCSKPMIEDKDYFYTLTAENDVLTFKVFTPSLTLRPGYKDRYTGGIMKTVLIVKLRANSREIEFVLGSRDELDKWLALIRLGRVSSINEEKDVDIIRKVFHKVLDVYSLQMFFHIYQTKGLDYEPILNTGEEASLCSIKNAEYRQYFHEMYIKTALHDICGMVILEVFVRDRNSLETHFLVSRNYVYSSRGSLSLEDLFTYDVVADKCCEDDIKLFDLFYPEFSLSTYWDFGGRNILLPLLSGDFHKGIELLSKSGCRIASAWKKIQQLEKDPALYKNIKDLFQLPVSVLRKLNSQQVMVGDQLFPMLIWFWNSSNRRYLELDNYTNALLEFFRDIYESDRPNRRLSILEVLTPEQNYKVARYFSTPGMVNDYYLWRDYVHDFNSVDELPDGLTPRNIYESHNRVVQQRRLEHYAAMSGSFKEVINTEEYKSLSTEYGEYTETFSNSEYAVIIPDSVEDVVREGMLQHNCVAGYVDRVCTGVCKIVFVRKRNKIDVPFVTVEVRENKIVQAKAKYNQKPDKNVRLFMIKWAEIIGLRVSTFDLTS